MTFAPKHILVPLAVEDGDELNFAADAVTAACDIGKKFGSQVTLLHFAAMPTKLPPQSTDASAKIYQTLAMVLEQRLSAAKDKLAGLQKQAESNGVKAKLQVADTNESIAHAICHAATKESADMILIGSHARRGLRKILLGSVAERVVHLSPVHVLLLRHDI